MEAELVAAAGLRLEVRGKRGGAACAGPLRLLPLPFLIVGPRGRPLVSPGGMGSVPTSTDGEWECWSSQVRGE